jgi:DNA-directed RNA polymerase specialized sigma24 family protein
VEAALTREHAAFARALLCRVTVEAYAGLPAPTQRMFWTRLVEGATWAAVAADAGTSEAAAKRRLQRASRTLAGRVAARVRDLSPEHAAVVEALCHRLGVELPMAVRGRPPAVHRA